MIADSFMFQGRTHEVCEDYVLHGDDYFVLSDGCSNGGVRIDTDFGARLICKAAQRSKHLILQPNLFLEQTMVNANLNRMSLGLPPESLAATLLVGCRTETNHRCFFCGDGFYGSRTCKGVWTIHKIEFLPSVPNEPPTNFYPSYILNPELMERYLQEEGHYKVTTSIGKFGEGFDDPCIFCGTFTKTIHHIYSDFPIDEYDLTFAASDGLGSFSTIINKKHTEIPYLEVMQTIFDFVQYGPGFLRHQCNWCFKQNKKGTFPNLGWHNSDDVAIGVLYESTK